MSEAHLQKLSSMVSTIMRPDNVNYEPVVEHNPRYKFTRVPPTNNPTDGFPLEASATTLVEITFPANKPVNSTVSNLDYQIVVPAQGAVANTTLWVYEDTAEIISQVQFSAGDTSMLVELQSANNYVSCARKIDTNKEDFEALDITSGLYKHNGAPSTNYFPPGVVFPAGAPAASGAQATGLGLVEPRYVKPYNGLVQNVITRSIPLSAFTNTLFAVNKDLIFPVPMTLSFMLAPSKQVAYTTLSPTNPALVPLALINQPIVKNLMLHLAVQQDPATIAVVQALYDNNQMQFVYPHTTTWKQTTTPGQPSISINFSGNRGKRLKRILHVPFSAEVAPNLAYDHQNINGVKISSYQTALDTTFLQNSVVSCEQPSATAINMGDYRENRAVIKGSAIESATVYGYNWFHCDSFSNPDRNRRAIVPESNIVEGLPLTMKDATWSSQFTSPVSLTNYVFVTFLREVKLTPSGIIML